MRALLFIVFSFFLTAQGWALPDCVGDRGPHWTNCFGTIEGSSEKYVGEFRDGQRHGEGIFT